MTGIRAGGIAVLMTLLGGCGETAIVTDPDTLVPTTVSITPATVSLPSLGATEALVATVRDQNGDPMTAAATSFVSSVGAVATVSSSGLVTAVAAGQTTITATSGTASGSSAVSVEQVAASVVGAPSTMTLDGPGSTAQATATARDAGGSMIPSPDLVWSSDDEGVATVGATGEVTGVAQGTTTITVEATNGGASVTGTMSVEVLAGTATLAVTTASLVNGEENATYGPVTLAAIGGAGGYGWALAAGSDPLPSGLALSADGVITGTPTTVGTSTFTVEVTSGAESAQRALSITVTAASARVIYFEEGFEDTNVVARGWFGNTSFTITGTEAYSGSSSLEMRYRRGADVPEFGGGSRKLFTATQSLYVSYRVKYSTNWIGSGLPYHPHEFTVLTNEDDQWVGPTNTRLTILIEHNYQAGILPKVSMSDQVNIDQSQIGVDLTGVTENRAVSGCNGNADGYASACYDQGGGVYTNNKELFGTGVALTADPGPNNQNDWHFVEVFLQLNSVVGGIGQADGIIQYWMDGVPFIDADDVFFRTGQYPDMGFFEFMIAPYIGAGSPVDQTFWIDDLVVGNRR